MQLTIIPLHSFFCHGLHGRSAAGREHPCKRSDGADGMSITCEPDVSRVLSKLGRRSFNYVSFGNGPVPPVTPPAAPGKLDSPLLPGPTPHPAPASRQDGSQDQSVAAAFSLLEAALPGAA